MSASETSSGAAPPQERAQGLDELGAAAVVEGDPELEAIEVRGLVLERRHLRAQLRRHAVTAAEEARSDALLREVGKLALDRLVQELDDRRDLVGRPSPVLGGERVDRERLDAEVDCRLDRAAEGSRALTVPLGDREAASRRPASVPVHDQRDVARPLPPSSGRVTPP